MINKQIRSHSFRVLFHDIAYALFVNLSVRPPSNAQLKLLLNIMDMTIYALHYEFYRACTFLTNSYNYEPFFITYMYVV